MLPFERVEKGDEGRKISLIMESQSLHFAQSLAFSDPVESMGIEESVTNRGSEW